ncbi:MAG: Era-like GTP-binding protein [Xanthomonadales bacterium]|nr:Era-like GTP-binding protein [Xanthomonadales bacterium]
MATQTRKVVSLLLLVALLILVLIAAERTVALAQRLAELPLWLQWSVGIVLGLFALGALWLAWTLLRPSRKRKRAAATIDRASMDSRLRDLDNLGADTAPLHAEVAELDHRRQQARLYVAVFGEISSGKSSLIAALTTDAVLATDVIGGTTQSVTHHNGQLDGGRTLTFADVPGSAEIGGERAEAVAREEALRAHIVLYVCAGDLSRSQGEELHWLAGFGKPLIVVLNKIDQWQAAQRDALLQRLRERSRGIASDVVAVSAGGNERFTRTLADGRSEQVERQRGSAVQPLRQALQRLARPSDAEGLESARESAVLAGLDQRTSAIEHSAREQAAQSIITRYTRRAVVGALAAVVPGSDIVIQGVLATGLIRELGKLYDVPLRDVEIERFLGRIKLTLRTSTSIALAIAGNALKAFPGLGTLGGGALHAIAYGLLFDSLGHAVAQTLHETRSLDSEQASATLNQLLTDTSAQHLRRIASYALNDAHAEHGDERT